jgi:hypothetical protein
MYMPTAAKLNTHQLSALSIGLSLTDTLDDLINEGRIEPQLAMRILGTFDRVVTEVLADKVRARLTFKVHMSLVSLFWLLSYSLGVSGFSILCGIDGLRVPSREG